MVPPLFTNKISDSVATEMFKVSKGLCPEIMKGIFQFGNKIPYNLRQRSQFNILPTRTVFSNTESTKFLAPKIWELIPGEMKVLESLWEFKRAIKKWKPTSSPSRRCKQYFHRMVFFNKVFCFINNIISSTTVFFVDLLTYGICSGLYIFKLTLGC